VKEKKMKIRKPPSHRSVLLFIAAITLWSHNAYSATVNYDELTDGDLPDSSSPLFLFDVGNNTIAGFVSAITTPTVSIDFDDIFFRVPAGAALTATTIDIFNVSSDDNLSLAQWDLETFAGTSIESLSIPIPSFGKPLFAANLPLGPDDYLLDSAGLSGGAGGGEARYFFQFQVEVVPVPPAVWLFGSALGLLGWIRQRKAVGAIK
jgi:hypothetical protein